MIRRPVVCLMGPTASGKTDIAVRLQQRFPMDIISVDSALVYRGMNIGTAKPDADTLEIAPHRLIDIRDPEQAYSAGDFVVDAQREIDSIHSAGRIPLLVGGTMMYFRSLTEGLADLPQANEAVRQKLDAVARESGWPHMHARLSRIDPAAAKRINENDSQRIQRALEVYETSGKTLTEWHAIALPPNTQYRFIKVAVVAADRQLLHERIGERFESMLDQGFVVAHPGTLIKRYADSAKLNFGRCRRPALHQVIVEQDARKHAAHGDDQGPGDQVGAVRVLSLVLVHLLCDITDRR